jgi:CDP-diacylglycerol--serine O-phosphatidyltransferase
MNKQKYPVIPSVFTIGTLVAGMVSMVLVLEGRLLWAGTLILVGVLADTVDGKIARATQSSSRFGVELDSLADMVCFGVAAALFAYQLLRLYQLSILASLVAVLPVPIAGVFRLARFNLQPVKTGNEDYTLGLPITVAGAILALAGLSDLHYSASLFPVWTTVLLPLALALLMISRVRFFSFNSVLRRKKTTTVVLGLGTLLSISFSPQLISLTVVLSYVGLGVARAGWGLTNR